MGESVTYHGEIWGYEDDFDPANESTWDVVGSFDATITALPISYTVHFDVAPDGSLDNATSRDVIMGGAALQVLGMPDVHPELITVPGRIPTLRGFVDLRIQVWHLGKGSRGGWAFMGQEFDPPEKDDSERRCWFEFGRKKGFDSLFPYDGALFGFVGIQAPRQIATFRCKDASSDPLIGDGPAPLADQRYRSHVTVWDTYDDNPLYAGGPEFDFQAPG